MPVYFSAIIAYDADDLHRNLTETTHITMSGQVVSFVPVLDGTNYLEWARLMEAYLKMQNLWSLACGNWDKLVPKDASAITEKEQEKIDLWDDDNLQIIGTMLSTQCAAA